MSARIKVLDKEVGFACFNMFLCSGNALWIIRQELATRLQRLLLRPPHACYRLQSLLPPPELAAARCLASRIEAWPKADLLQDVQSSKNLRCPATDSVIRLRPTDHRYSTCSEPDPKTASYSHPTDRPTDSLDLPARHGENLDLICLQNMK